MEGEAGDHFFPLRDSVVFLLSKAANGLISFKLSLKINSVFGMREDQSYPL